MTQLQYCWGFCLKKSVFVIYLMHGLILQQEREIIMSEDTILCHQCGKDLVMKFIEFKDLVLCSSSCFEKFKNSMSRRDFYKHYGDGFLPDEQK